MHPYHGGREAASGEGCPLECPGLDLGAPRWSLPLRAELGWAGPRAGRALQGHPADTYSSSCVFPVPAPAPRQVCRSMRTSGSSRPYLWAVGCRGRYFRPTYLDASLGCAQSAAPGSRGCAGVRLGSGLLYRTCFLRLRPKVR